MFLPDCLSHRWGEKKSESPVRKVLRPPTDSRAVAIRSPLGEMEIDPMGIESVSRCSSWPVCKSQIRTVLSLSPVATLLPSGRKATDVILLGYSSNLRTSFPSSTLHRMAAYSLLAVRTNRPSGENAMAETPEAGPGWGVGLGWAVRRLELVSKAPAIYTES